MKGLNLAGFKKIAQDQKSATMRHEKGHEIKIYLHALPKIQQEQIRRIKLDNGGQVQPPPPPPPQQDPDKTLAAQESMRKAFNFDDGGSVPDDSSSDSSDNSDPGKSVTINVNAAPGSTPQSPVQNAAMRVPASISAPQPSMDANQSEAAKSLVGVNQAQNAIQQQQKVDAANAAAQVPAYQAQLAALQDNDKRNKAAQDTINAAAQSLSDYQKQQNPTQPNPGQDQYIKNMPTGEKVATAIGLIVGGFHAGFSGQNNPALDFLNQKIAQNIQQQQQYMDNKKSVFSAFHQAFGDNAIASNLTAANAKEQLANKIQLEAAKLGTPQSQINAKLATDKLLSERDAYRQNAAGILGSKYNQIGSGQSGAQPVAQPNAQPNQPAPIQQNQGIIRTSAPSNPSNASSSNDSSNDIGLSDIFNPSQLGGKLLGKAFGSNKAEDQGPRPSIAPEKMKLLVPNAREIMAHKMKFDPTITPEDRGIMPTQMSAASQAEKGLQKLPDVFNNFSDIVQKGGMKARVLRNFTPDSLTGLGAAAGAGIGGVEAGSPGIGGAAGAAIGNTLGHLVPDIKANREYNRARTELAGILSSALQGRGDNFVAKAVHDFSPEYGDSPQDLQDKLNGIVDFIRLHTTTDALKGHHLANE